MYNLWYNAKELKNNSGNKVPVNFDLDAFASVQRIIHVTNTKILGADYLYDVLVPVVEQDITLGATSDNQSLTIGDIVLEPFALSWHKPRWDAIFALAVIAPTGRYSSTDIASPGLGYWSGMLTLGGTYYLDNQKTWSLSALSRTLINNKQDETDVRPGPEFLLEYGLGKEIQVNNSLMIRPGFAGASYWQIGDDSKDFATAGIVADQHKQSHALGAEVNLLYLPKLIQLNLRYMQEYSVENAPEGSRFIATLTKSF